MTDAVAIRADPTALVREARARSRGGRVGTASADMAWADPLASYRAARRAGLDVAFWMRPDDGTALLAVGSVASVESRGDDRVRALRSAWSDLRPLGPDGGHARAFVGVSFDERSRAVGPDWADLPRAVLIVPRLLVERRAGSTTAYVTARGDDATDDLDRLWDVLEGGASSPAGANARAERVDDLPSRERWRADVAAAREEIRQGLLEKIVLARAVALRVDANATTAALDMLVRRARGCTVFAVARGSSIFLGATPESLVTLAERTASVSCVAGTAPRDGRSALALLRSTKDQREHAVVVRAALAALETSCEEVTATGPRPLELATMWHLASDVRGRTRPGIELLDLAAALHPTPAVCGAPRELAARRLAEREAFDRGWYAGALGWVDARGDGELVVALRSALVRATEAWVFAGCGIVEGSDPDLELAEADAKMRPMIDALGGA